MSGVKAPRMGNSDSDFFEAINPGTSQKVAYTGTHGVSTAFAATTQLIRVVATSNAHIAVGAAPTAAADGTSMYLPLGVAVLIMVTGGHKISAVQDSGSGNLFVTEAVSV